MVDDNTGKDLTGKHRVPDAEEIFKKTEDPYLIKTKQKKCKHEDRNKISLFHYSYEALFVQGFPQENEKS